jgi:hypothetical protein
MGGRAPGRFETLAPEATIYLEDKLKVKKKLTGRNIGRERRAGGLSAFL